MLKKSRIQYFISTLIVIALGITSRKMVGVPMFFGDTLYAVMIYFGMRIFFIHLDTKTTAIIALLICFGIEFSQLYQADWLVVIRRSTLGHYVLGQGFLWSDLIFYSSGVTIGFIIDSKLFKKDKAF